MESLPLFFRLKGRPVILLGAGDAAAAKRRLLERAGALVVGEDDKASLAMVAIDDDQEAADAVARLKTRGILVNATDRPELCDFTVPAIVDRDPVLIAIGTGGASAGLAKAVRQRLEAILPQALGSIATALHDAREAMRRRWPHADERRRAIDTALAEGGPLDPLGTTTAEAVVDWLDMPTPQSAPSLRVFALRSDDPDQLTLEQARLLGQADLVVHAPDLPQGILSRARADARRLAQDHLPEVLPHGLTVQLVRETR